MNNKIFDIESSQEINIEDVNLKIIFTGSNNSLYIHKNNRFTPTTIVSFKGDDSVVYLEKSKYHYYGIKLIVYNNSTIYIGPNFSCSARLVLQAFEERNIIIGNDCM